MEFSSLQIKKNKQNNNKKIKSHNKGILTLLLPKAQTNSGAKEKNPSEVNNRTLKLPLILFPPKLVFKARILERDRISSGAYSDVVF